MKLSTLVPALLLAASLPAQINAKTTNIGGGCQPAKGGFTKVSKAVAGKDWVLEWGFPEPWLPEAWVMLGVKNPDVPFGNGCRLKTSAEFGLLLGRSFGMGGQLKLRVPNDPSILGKTFYVQGAWWAQNFPVALTDGYSIFVGTK